MKRALALCAGVLTHSLFAAGVGMMLLSLYTGLQSGLGHLHGRAAFLANAFLALQYPVLHSFFLATHGRRFLERIVPHGLGRDLSNTVYVAFALTLWTGPVWTPDRLALATIWTGYCLLGPLLKERRYAAFYGERFERYRAEVPYWLPRLLPWRPHG